MFYPGYELGGELLVSHISFPPSLTESNDLKIATNDYVALLPRPAEAYKGSTGDVLIIAGAANYYGAPYFAAMSFLKSGGGYARLAAPRCVVPGSSGKGGYGGHRSRPFLAGRNNEARQRAGSNAQSTAAH